MTNSRRQADQNYVLSVPECTKTRLFELKNQKHFLGTGAWSPPHTSPPVWHPSPYPTTSTPSALRSLRLWCWTRLAPSALDLGAVGYLYRRLQRLGPMRLHCPPHPHFVDPPSGRITGASGDLAPLVQALPQTFIIGLRSALAIRPSWKLSDNSTTGSAPAQGAARTSCIINNFIFVLILIGYRSYLYKS